MNLVCDIGNTNIVFGIFQNDELILQFRISTLINRSSDEYAVIILTILKENYIHKNQIQTVVISSVVPPLLFHLKNTFRKYFNLSPLILNSEMNLGIKNLYNPPKHVGIDRLVNSLAGYEKYKTALIIIDFGTATTFDVVSSKGEYIGGVITPVSKYQKKHYF
jgi:type III pantothenate kinase